MKELLIGEAGIDYITTEINETRGENGKNLEIDVLFKIDQDGNITPDTAEEIYRNRQLFYNNLGGPNDQRYQSKLSRRRR